MKVDIEALLFDLGGVMFGIDFERALRSWEPFSELSLDELRERFSMDAAYERHERGEIDAAGYFAHLRVMLDLDATDAQITEGWNAIYLDEFTETVDAVCRAARVLPCFAFTNTNPTHQRHWTTRYPRVASAFKHVFSSSELGLRKPERAAFDAIVEATGVAASNILFFDDLTENVAGAEAAGLSAVLVRYPRDVTKALTGVI